MKNIIHKNKPNTSIFIFLLLLFFMGYSQLGSAQTKDPLIVKNDKVEVNRKLEATNAIFSEQIQGTSAYFTDNFWIDKNLKVLGNLTVNGAIFTAKNASIAGNINNAFIGDVGYGADYAGFSHKDAKARTSYGFLQLNTGLITLINKAPGKGWIGFRVGNVDKMVIMNNGNVGIGTKAPKSNLDISGGSRTGTHPTSVPGLYVTGNFAPSSSGVEFRHANGTQGIGFGYNTIYATGSNANQDLNLKPRGTGKVGIGTTTPKALLHVASKNIRYTVGVSRGLLHAYNDVVRRNYGVRSNTSILADGDIISKTGVFTQSDIRIKKNIHTTSTADDLQSLKAIDIVNYEMIDDIADNRKYKKVVAQQIQEVYPIAVQQEITSFIPSVFQASLSIDKVATDEYRLAVADNHNLAVNDQVDLKCYPANSSVVVKVSKIISPTEFVVTSDSALDTYQSIFVYGKQVDDLLSVDYDAIAMLNVSATQEIAKQTEQLQSENQALKAQIAELKKQQESLHASVNQLQAMILNRNNDNLSRQTSEK